MPIELGEHYVDPTWSQKLMTVGEFIEAHIVPQMEENTPVGYLAQHPLFEQVFHPHLFTVSRVIFKVLTLLYFAWY